MLMFLIMSFNLSEQEVHRFEELFLIEVSAKVLGCLKFFVWILYFRKYVVKSENLRLFIAGCWA